MTALQASPIILTGGIATQLGGALPIIALTEAGGLLGSALSGASALSEILAGAALVSQIFANVLPKTRVESRTL